MYNLKTMEDLTRNICQEISKKENCKFQFLAVIFDKEPNLIIKKIINKNTYLDTIILKEDHTLVDYFEGLFDKLDHEYVLSIKNNIHIANIEKNGTEKHVVSKTLLDVEIWDWKYESIKNINNDYNIALSKDKAESCLWTKIFKADNRL